MDHPKVTEIRQHGHLKEHLNTKYGRDWKGKEVSVGDEIVIDPELDEILFKDDLPEYLAAKYGFEFTTAERGE